MPDRLDNPMHTTPDREPPAPCDGQPFCDEVGTDECHICGLTFCDEHWWEHDHKIDVDEVSDV